MTKLVEHNGNGSSNIRSWMLFVIPLVAIFLTWFANWTLMKSKIPELQKAQEKLELKSDMIDKDLQSNKLTTATAIASMTAILQGIDSRLVRIENNTRR